MNQYFATIYRYRWLIYELVLRNLRLRYRGSILGFTWTLANPLLFMGIYTLVFSFILKNGIAHFPLYLLAGIVPWTRPVPAARLTALPAANTSPSRRMAR